MGMISVLQSLLNTALFVTTTTLSFFNAALHGEIQGRAEVAAAYVHIDVIKDNNTEKKMDLPAVKGDATIVFYEGWCLKPSILYGDKDGRLFTAALGFGRTIPFMECFCVTPSVGVSYTDMQTDLKDFVPGFGELHFDAEFESTSPYVNIDLSYKFCDCWRLVGNVQYAWSRSHSKYKERTFKTVSHDKGSSSGFNYGGMIEYDFTDCWSINVGAAYNNSLSKDKDGLRGFGTKIGIVRWF